MYFSEHLEKKFSQGQGGNPQAYLHCTPCAAKLHDRLTSPLMVSYCCLLNFFSLYSTFFGEPCCSNGRHLAEVMHPINHHFRDITRNFLGATQLNPTPSPNSTVFHGLHYHFCQAPKNPIKTVLNSTIVVSKLESNSDHTHLMTFLVIHDQYHSQL